MGWIKDDGIKDDPKQQAAVLAACILGHLALGFWLVHERPDAHHDDVALEIRFIPRASEPVQMIAPPPFPAAPQRPAPSRVTSQSQPRATLSAPPDRPVQRAESPPSDWLQPRPSTARLLDAASAAARASVGTAMPTPRDPTQRHAPRLAGREESYTPKAYVLRKEITPEAVVNAIGGMLFGGQIDPCPDTQSKIRDLVARNDSRSEDELRVLIDRERRRCR